MAGQEEEELPLLPDSATAEKVENLIGRPLKEGEKALAGELLDTAWLYLLDDVPTLEDRLSKEEPRLPAKAGAVLVAAVTRVVRNPEGWRQVGLDDFQGTRDSVLSAGLLQFTAEELARLQPREASLPGFYSLRQDVPYWGR